MIGLPINALLTSVMLTGEATVQVAPAASVAGVPVVAAPPPRVRVFAELPPLASPLARGSIWRYPPRTNTRKGNQSTRGFAKSCGAAAGKVERNPVGAARSIG